MKNGPLRPAPPGGRRRTLKRPARSTGPSPIPWSARARYALGPSVCRGGGVVPLPVPDTMSRTTAALPPTGGARRPGGLLPG